MSLNHIVEKLYVGANDTIRLKATALFRTGNVIVDTGIATLVLTAMSFSVKVMYESFFETSGESVSALIFNMSLVDMIRYWCLRKNTVILSGKKCSSTTWNCVPVVTSVFGDRFKAVWREIIQSVETNATIYEIKDSLLMTDSLSRDDNVFIVTQRSPFLFDKQYEIYARTRLASEESTSETNEHKATKIDNIDIILFSYKSSLFQIKECIDAHTCKYLAMIKTIRDNKRFIYTLIKTKYEDSRFECWKESVFQTTRRFENMFFEQKEHVLEKLDFFLGNRDWYYKKGIPYTIGFGLHGPPGTGKTSFVKSLASYTQRHIVVLSLKLIRTPRQLHEFFYEDRYNSNNEAHSVGFENKIIVIEDIDAQGAIVRNRTKNKLNSAATCASFGPNADSANIDINEVIKNLIHDSNNAASLAAAAVASTCSPSKIDDVEEQITLDDILNLWDGIEETSGRILVISSNHYRELDPALTRPGRIDVSVFMDNASHGVIRDLHRHLYERDIDEGELTKVEPYFYSAAELVNLYSLNKNDPVAFVNILKRNKRLDDFVLV
jgi:hypothetical protein